MREHEIEDFAVPFAAGCAVGAHIFAQGITLTHTVAVGVFAFGGCYLGARAMSVVYAIGRAILGRTVERRSE